MSLNRTQPDSEFTFFDFEPWETKIAMGAAVSLIAFGIIVGPLAALAISGHLMRFFTLKANLTIGQGLLYIALPVIGGGTITSLGVKHGFIKFHPPVEKQN